jgi:hypothetical protein
MWSLRSLSMSKWAIEVECAFYQIEAWKQIWAPQYLIDGVQGRIDRHEPWW